MLPGGDEKEGHRITSLRRSDPKWSGIVRPEIRLTHRWSKPDSNSRSPLKKGRALPPTLATKVAAVAPVWAWFGT